MAEAPAEGQDEPTAAAPGEGAVLVTGPSHDGDVRVRDVIRLLERDGWRQVRQTGSHRQFRHPTKPGTVTVAGKPSAELKRGTLASVMRQADLKGPMP